MKLMFVVLNVAVALLLLSGLTACRHMPFVQSARVKLKVVARYAGSDSLIPRRVYVFPPLKVDHEGVPTEKHIPSVDGAGQTHWHTSSPDAAGMRVAIERQLRKQGFHTVTFRELTEERDGHSILVFFPYYSGVLADKDGSKQKQTHFVRLSGATFSESLDASQKRELINQEVLITSPVSADTVSMLNVGFWHAVKRIGKNDEWVEGYTIKK